MALVSHTIYSHYNIETDKIQLDQPERTDEIETRDGVVSVPDADVRQLVQIPKQFRPPPQFVKGVRSYDDWEQQRSLDPIKVDTCEKDDTGQHLSRWYRSITNNYENHNVVNPAPSPPSSQEKLQTRPPKPQRDKNNWFIMKALESELPSSIPAASSSLADILARDPPPLPSEQRYTPPVWLEIGPSNRGFRMLQRSGWNEGEALGPYVKRRQPIDHILPVVIDEGKGKQLPNLLLEQPETEPKVVDDVSRLQGVEVIDLTLSDSESDGKPRESGEEMSTIVDSYNSPSSVQLLTSDVTPSHGGKALLTPIATILKSDRLGIGLKAKTSGPYKSSVKRVTHNAAALAAHIKASEEIRKRQHELGRGRRGFEKQRRKQESDRKAMLAYLNN